jgi:hypothetical protein
MVMHAALTDGPPESSPLPWPLVCQYFTLKKARHKDLTEKPDREFSEKGGQLNLTLVRTDRTGSAD